jgi:hypothetical protein
LKIQYPKIIGIIPSSIPYTNKYRIHGQTDISGNPIRDFGQFSKEHTDSFEFKFIEPEDLKTNEKIFDRTEDILRLVGGKPKVIKEIKVSETMRKQAFEHAFFRYTCLQ